MGPKRQRNLTNGLAMAARAAGIATAVMLMPTVPAAAQCQMAKVIGADTALRDGFGATVALDGKTLVVGALNHGNTGGNLGPGAAYVFEFDGTQWVQVAKLASSDLALDDEFGVAVAIHGDTIVVGAKQNDDAGSNSGSAYVFVKPQTGWQDMMTETAKFTASDAATGDIFGIAVAIFCDTIAVGAHNKNDNTGAVYVFEKPVGGWSTMTETVKLTASDGALDDRFGVKVAIDCNTIVAGADQANRGGPGAAYVFERQACTWVQTAKLTASDGLPLDRLGSGVAVRGRLILAGAFIDNVDGNTQRGSAYLFERPPGGWTSTTETAKLTASFGATNDGLGLSTSILDCDTLFVGTAALLNSGTTSPGYVCMYKRPIGGWVSMTETAVLEATDGMVADQFGVAIATSCDTLVVGANRDDDNGNESGSGYVFAGISMTDYNGNGVPDVCQAQLCPWDLNRDGVVNVLDLIDLLLHFGQTCPF